VVVTLEDGRTLTNRVAVNRGNPDRPLANAEIEAKYFENCALTLEESAAHRIRDAVLELESIEDAREFEALVAADFAMEAVT
jgi:2-methylcitrate dehydratase PrpD